MWRTLLVTENRDDRDDIKGIDGVHFYDHIKNARRIEIFKLLHTVG